jgi:hypothetical protein
MSCSEKEKYLIPPLFFQGVNLSLDDARVAFDEKDRDGDGKISLEEFLGKRTDMEKAWNALDSDRNG